MADSNTKAASLANERDVTDWKALYEQTSQNIERMARESARVRMPAELRDLLANPRGLKGSEEASSG